MDDRTIADAALADDREEAPVPVGIPAAEPPRPSWWDRLMTAETGEGPIAGYRDHTLNFTNDEVGARFARGLTGLFDNLNLAVIDLLISGIQMGMRGLKKPVASQAGDTAHVGS